MIGLIVIKPIRLEYEDLMRGRIKSFNANEQRGKVRIPLGR